MGIRGGAVPGTQLHWTASRDQLETELQAANGERATGPSGGDDLQRLNHRLQGLGQFVTLEMEGDGNCQVRGGSDSSSGSQAAGHREGEHACEMCSHHARHRILPLRPAGAAATAEPG